MIETDNLEKKLKEYNEYSQAEISDGFLQKLKALEENRTASLHSHKRYIPLAAALVTAALLFVSGWAYVRFFSPVDTQTPGINGLQFESEDQALVKTDETSSVKLDGTGTAQPNNSVPEKPDKAPPAKPDKSAPTEPNNTTPLNPDNTAPTEPNNTAPANPDNSAPTEPNNTTPANPDNSAPTEPNNTTPANPDNSAPTEPNNTTPVNPDNTAPTDQKPDSTDDPLPSEPAGTDPPVEIPPNDEPPSPPPQEVQLGAEYHIEGSRELLTLTLLSTCESIDIDVSGWIERIPPDEQPPQQDNPHSLGRNELRYYGSCAAFGKTVNYCLILDKQGTVHVELIVMDPE